MYDADQAPEAPDASLPVDPELEGDLGPEFDLRGDQLESALEQARAEAAHNLDIAQRLKAEFDNYRKRVQRDQADALKRAGERIVTELLPVVDNLERAIDHGVLEASGTELLKGVEMVFGQLVGVLDKEGVVQLDPLGKPFDALQHHAVGQKEDPDVPEGTVVEVYQKGYEMHGRVIRSAMVVVATGGPAAAEE